MRIREKDLERELKALANARRLAILKYLQSKKEAIVGEIAEAINLSFKSTSRHLSVLKSSELVEYEQRGLAYYYSLPKTLSSLTRATLSLL